MLRLAHLTSLENIENGTAWALGHFRRLFGREVQNYIKSLTSTTKPAAVIVCMIYQPLESPYCTEKSWADAQLKALKYDSTPQKLQAAIRSMYKEATAKIEVDGVKVVPLPLYEVMDGKEAADYVERVEPSVEGGKKMSEKIVEVALQVLGKEKSEGGVGDNGSVAAGVA
jgi:hypothetical protein